MVEKQGQKIRAGVSPPPFRAMPKRKHFFFREGFPEVNYFGTFAFSLGVHHQIWREFTICVKVGNNCALDIIPKLMHLSKKYSYVNLQTNKNQNGGVVTVLKLMHLR